MANQTEHQFRAVGFIDKSKQRILQRIAFDAGTSVKGMVEAYLNALADINKGYIPVKDLYAQLERTTQLLRELQGEEKIESELPI